ncbi:SPFH domain-containing protein [Candidatus Woesebacteria bacterium]|nr:SPFH domain-containing protein [Candidatus Woesebacteria bacterium]
MKTFSRFFVFAMLILLLAGCAAPPAAPTSPPAMISDALATGSYGSNLMVGFVWIIVAFAILVAMHLFIPLVKGKRLLVGATAIILLIATFGYSGYVTVDAGQVGVLLRQGAAVKTLEPGGHVIMPFVEEARIFSIRQWTYSTMPDPVNQGTEEYRDFSVDLPTKDGVQSKVNYTLQGRLDPAAAVEVYSRYGTLENAISQLVKNPSRVMVRELLQNYDAAELITAVDSVNEAVSARLGAQMEEGGLELIFFGFRKPTLGIDGAYERILDAQQVAIRDAELQKAQIPVQAALAEQAAAQAEGAKQVAIKQAEARAESTLAEQKANADAALYSAEQQAAAQKVLADGQAYQITAEADAQAAANEKLARSLTPTLVDYIKWSGWNGQLPQWVTGGDPLLTVPVKP